MNEESEKRRVVIIGSSGHAGVVIDIIEREDIYKIVGLIDPSRKSSDQVFGYKILGSEEDLVSLQTEHQLHGCIIAIGDNWKRQIVAEKISNIVPGLRFVSAVHPSAQVGSRVSIGEGSVIMAGAVVNCSSRIERFCILNTNCSLDHDCYMGKFSSLAPGVATGGNVEIGDYSFIGLGANIIQRVKIGSHSVVGAGSLVLSDVPECSVVYGVPARVVKRRKEEESYL